MRLRLRLVLLSGTSDLHAEVLRPDGTTVCEATRLDDSTCRLDRSGLHTVLVYDGAPVVSRSTYALEARRLDVSTPCSPLAFGAEPKTSGVSVAGSTCHRVDVAAGDALRVRVRTEGPLRPQWEVIRSNGTTRCSVIVEMSTCRADTSGTHLILIRDASPGTRSGIYQVSVQRLNDPVGCTPGWLSPDATRAEITFGQTPARRPGSARTGGRCSGSTTRPAARRSPAAPRPRSHRSRSPRRRFHGTAGERIALELNQRSGDFEPHLELLRPDARWISRSSTNGTLIYDSERLPETGWYTVLVRDRGTGLNTGVYDIALDYGSSTRPR